jgi:hypothetical protein
MLSNSQSLLKLPYTKPLTLRVDVESLFVAAVFSYTKSGLCEAFTLHVLGWTTIEKDDPDKC